MADPRTRRFKTIVAEVNDVLYTDWAPIGCAGLLPKDEYEPYAIRVVSLLASVAEDVEIANYLATTAASVGGKLLSVDSVVPVVRKIGRFREAARAIAL